MRLEANQQMRSNMKRILLGALAALLSFSALAATLTPIQLLNPAGSTNGQVIASTGPTTAPSWATLSLATSNLAPIAANTVLANGTGASARPIAFSMPSCGTTSFALIWTSGTGFACNTSINAATLGGATFASPGAIGSTSSSTGKFTSLSATANSKVFATNTSGQIIPNSALTAVTGWTTVLDANSNFTASTGTFTAPQAGQYLVSFAALNVAANYTPGSLQSQIYKNGVAFANTSFFIGSSVTGQSLGYPLIVALVNCAAGDLITVRVFQNSGAAITLYSADAIHTFLSITQVP
jgi:hypothetical protein